MSFRLSKLYSQNELPFDKGFYNHLIYLITKTWVLNEVYILMRFEPPRASFLVPSPASYLLAGVKHEQQKTEHLKKSFQEF